MIETTQVAQPISRWKSDELQSLASLAGMTASNRAFGWSWLGLCAALALHVLDEALTGFLDVYNPTVLSLRESFGWFPMPVIRYDVWLRGLIGAVLGLSALSIFAFRGAGWMRKAAMLFSVLMIANAFGHTLGTIFGQTVATVRFPRPMPGFYSSPFLFLAAVNLVRRSRSQGRSWDHRRPD